MRPIRRFVGLLVVIISAASLLVSLYMLFQIWRLRVPVASNLQSHLSVISATLATTNEGLLIAGSSLTNTQTSITALQATVDTLGRSIDDTTPLVETLTSLLGADLPDTVTSAQSSLGSAQQSAKLIDSFLRFLTSIAPGIYNPDVPLDVALGQVAQSLDGLPRSFKTMETGLQRSQVNLFIAKVQIEQISLEIGEINESLEEAQKVVAQYQVLIAELQVSIGKLHDLIPIWMNTLAWGLSFIIFWLGVSQIGVMLRTREWMNSG